MKRVHFIRPYGALQVAQSIVGPFKIAMANCVRSDMTPAGHGRQSDTYIIMHVFYSVAVTI